MLFPYSLNDVVIYENDFSTFIILGDVLQTQVAMPELCRIFNPGFRFDPIRFNGGKRIGDSSNPELVPELVDL